MNATTKERISESQRLRWAQRKRDQERVRTQLEAHDAALSRYSRALGTCLAALTRHEASDPLAVYAMREIRAAFDQVAVWNTDARELLREHGWPDPTDVKPDRRDAGGEDGDADARHAPTEGDR